MPSFWPNGTRGLIWSRNRLCRTCGIATSLIVLSFFRSLHVKHFRWPISAAAPVSRDWCSASWECRTCILIESIGKKANFLRAVIEELKLDAKVLQIRIESIHNMKFDVITARALKPLPQLLKLAKPLMKKESICIFLKGQQLDVELTEAGKYWKFEYETFSSLSDRSGRVLKITNLYPIAGSEKHAARRNLK